jgi:hypothetical protein
MKYEFSHEKVAEPYRLAYCVNEKGLSSIVREIMCMLNQPDAYAAGNYSALDNLGISTM